MILHALVTMVCIYLVGLACTAVYTQLMAHVTQGFLHKLPHPHVCRHAEAARPLFRPEQRAAIS